MVKYTVIIKNIIGVKIVVAPEPESLQGFLFDY